MSPNRQPTVGAFTPDPSDHDCRLIASTVHGLEHLAAAELAERGHRVEAVRKRRLVLTSPRRLAEDRPGTVDDLLWLIAETRDPGHAKVDLKRLRHRLGVVVLSRARAVVGGGRPVISVSASMTGRRTYNRHDLEDVIGTVLAARLGVRFVSRRDGVRPPAEAVEWRAILTGEGLLLGLRGRRAPLHRRVWKTASVPGTLHPPVAAAMARLAGIEPGMTVLDPCCGAGTVLAEARESRPGIELLGTDVDTAAVAATAHNTRHLPDITVARADAARLPLPGGVVDRIVTNPAWDRQVAATRSFPDLLSEWRRLIAPGGRLVCLIPPELLRHFSGRSGWNVHATHQLSLAGQHPVIVAAEP